MASHIEPLAQASSRGNSPTEDITQAFNQSGFTTAGAPLPMQVRATNVYGQALWKEDWQADAGTLAGRKLVRRPAKGIKIPTEESETLAQAAAPAAPRTQQHFSPSPFAMVKKRALEKTLPSLSSHDFPSAGNASMTDEEFEDGYTADIDEMCKLKRRSTDIDVHSTAATPGTSPKSQATEKEDDDELMNSASEDEAAAFDPISPTPAMGVSPLAGQDLHLTSPLPLPPFMSPVNQKDD